MTLEWKEIASKIGLSIAASILIYLFVGVSFFTSMAVFIFIVAVDYALIVIEGESTIKRWLRKGFWLLAGIIIFLGIRMVAGYIIGMPLVSTWNSLDGIGLAGLPAQSTIPVQIILEMTFALPAFAMTWGLIKGGKTTKGIIIALSFFLFLAVAFQLKQPKFVQALSREKQASLNLKAGELNLEAYNKEVLALASWGEVLVGIGAKYEPLFDKAGNFVKMEMTKLDSVIAKDTVVVSTGPELKTMVFEGQPFVEIRLPNPESGGFIGGSTMWVEAYLVKWSKANPLTGGTKEIRKAVGEGFFIDLSGNPTDTFVLDRLVELRWNSETTSFDLMTKGGKIYTSQQIAAGEYRQVGEEGFQILPKGKGRIWVEEKK